MKITIALLICMALLLGLCACTGEPKETTPPPSAPVYETKAPEQPTEQAEPTETTEPQVTEETQDMVELIREYIDRPIEELYEVIGQPLSSDYASSCLGDGEDGLLEYDGFVVYTYREGDSEVVYDVE